MLKILLTTLALMFAPAASAAPEPEFDHDCPCLTATDCETPMPNETADAVLPDEGIVTELSLDTPAGIFAARFLRTANATAAHLGGPVYLVGSALSCDDPPNDYDVRCVVQQHDADRLFGLKPMNERSGNGWSDGEIARAREGLKQSRRFSRLYGVNVDFKVQTAEEFAGYWGRPKYRLDRIPDRLFNAGLGEA